MKFLVLLCASLILCGCSSKDEQYYRVNHSDLQKAVKNCPNKQPAGVSCQQLIAIAISTNHMGDQLHNNPQGFGKKILSLQVTLANQRQQLRENSDDSTLGLAIKKNEQQLAEHLAIVRWLESPES